MEHIDHSNILTYLKTESSTGEGGDTLCLGQQKSRSKLPQTRGHVRRSHRSLQRPERRHPTGPAPLRRTVPDHRMVAKKPERTPRCLRRPLNHRERRSLPNHQRKTPYSKGEKRSGKGTTTKISLNSMTHKSPTWPRIRSRTANGLKSAANAARNAPHLNVSHHHCDHYFSPLRLPSFLTRHTRGCISLWTPPPSFT